MRHRQLANCQLTNLLATWQNWQIMKLATYLSENGKTPSAFAAEIGCPASTVTRLLRGERSPGVDLMAKIKNATGGKVAPDDFLPTPQPEAQVA